MRRLWMLFLLAVGLLAQVLSDQQIEAQLRVRLAKSVIGKDGFTARVKDGVVYWEGFTTVAQHKGAATRMAKSAGAKRVVNNIRVGKRTPPRPLPREPKAQAAPPSPAPPADPPASLPKATVKWREIR